VKSKCGSTFCSASSTTLRGLPAWRSLSALMIASTSSVVRRTSASGASCAKAAEAPATRSSAAASLRNMGLPRKRLGIVGPAPAGGVPPLFLGVFLRLAEEELADEALEHHGRLRERDAVAVGELLVVAAR